MRELHFRDAICIVEQSERKNRREPGQSDDLPSLICNSTINRREGLIAIDPFLNRLPGPVTPNKKRGKIRWEILNFYDILQIKNT